MHSTPCRRSVSVFAKKFLKVALISTFAYLVTPSGIAMALAYRFTTIDVPGAIGTTARGVNDSGEIVGSFTDDTGSHGFLYKGGTFATLGPPGASQSEAASINNAGQIVGSFTDSAGQHGFLNVGGAFTTIDFPGATSTSGMAIDNAGRILGSFASPTDFSYFIAEGSNFTAFRCFVSFCFDFNDSGRVVGADDSEHGTRGFVADIDGGNYDEIGFPASGGRSWPYGINNAGQIVGTFWDLLGSEDDRSCCILRGFINVGGSSGTFIPLDHPAAFRDEAFSVGTNAINISDSGLIVGQFYDQEQKVHGFLAIPTVPEPASLMLFGVGLLGLSLASWRRYMSLSIFAIGPSRLAQGYGLCRFFTDWTGSLPPNGQFDGLNQITGGTGKYTGIPGKGVSLQTSERQRAMGMHPAVRLPYALVDRSEQA